VAPKNAAAHDDFVGKGDAAWKLRADPTQLDRAIAHWKHALTVRDDDWQTYEKLSHAYLFRAVAHLAHDASAQIEATKIGFEYARRGMAAYSPKFERLIQRGSSLENAIDVVDRQGIGLVYWYATNLGLYAKLRGNAAGLKYKGRLVTLIGHVQQSSPDFFYWGADRFFGAYYAALPSFMGGDLTKSREAFTRAIAGAPNYLANYVLMAEYYAVKADDRAMFDELLALVINVQACDASEKAPCIESELLPELEIARDYARRLIEQRDDLF